MKNVDINSRYQQGGPETRFKHNYSEVLNAIMAPDSPACEAPDMWDPMKDILDDNVAIFTGSHIDLPPDLDTAKELRLATASIRLLSELTNQDRLADRKNRVLLLADFIKIDDSENEPNVESERSSEKAWNRLSEYDMTELTPKFNR